MPIRESLRNSRLAKAFSRKPPSDQEISRAIDERMPPAMRDLLHGLGTDFGEMLRKEPRSIIPEVITTYGFLQEPPYDPFTLQKVYNMFWPVRTCIDKLIRETTRKGYRWEPLFESRCNACDTEYDFIPASGACPECQGTALTMPDPEQLVRVKKFQEHPNPDHSFLDVLEANGKDMLVFDDFYVSTGTKATALQVWCEDARYMRIEADKKGRLGGRTFCPLDEDRKPDGTASKLYNPTANPPGSPCPEGDGGTLKQMAYAQVMGADIMAAFAKEDMLHDNLFNSRARLYGTPKIWAVQTQIAAMMMVDQYQKDSFEKAKTPKNIILYKGVTDDSMRRAVKQYEEAKKLNAMADMHITVPQVIGVGQGNIGVEVIRGIDTPLIQGAIQYMEWWFQDICYTFGVDPSSLGVATPGRLGNANINATKEGASQEAVQEIQVQLAESWDRFLKLKFPEIKDWRFTLESAYEQEENEILANKKLEMEYAKLAVDSGLDVIVDEDGSIKVTGQNTKDDRMQMMATEASFAAAQRPPAPFGHGAPPQGGKSAATAASVSKATDFEKASIWQKELIIASEQYKARLDELAGVIFGRLMRDLNDYIGPNYGTVEPVTADLRDTIVSRSKKVLTLAANDVSPHLEEAAKALYQYGKTLGLSDIQKQDFSVAFDEEDSAAIEAFYNRTQDAMKNTLYLGDKETYLSRIHDITQACIEAGGCTTTILARKLAAELDPEKAHFSDYMWERLARTETAAYVTAGRLKAYEQYEIPMVRRIVTLDDRTDPIRCAPFSGAVYKVEDSYNVVPAHVNCRCAFAPYFGPEEPLDASEILYND